MVNTGPYHIVACFSLIAELIVVKYKYEKEFI